MSGNNRFSAFFSSLYHVVQESIGCTDFPLLAFSKFEMASNKGHERSQWEMPFFGGLTAPKPFDGFSKKFAQFISSATLPDMQK